MQSLEKPGLYPGNIGKVRTQFMFYEMCHSIPTVLHRDVQRLHRHSENVAFRCSNIVRGFLCVFLVDEGREDPNTTVSGPSLARQQNAIKMAFCWRADDVPALNACLVAL